MISRPPRRRRRHHFAQRVRIEFEPECEQSESKDGRHQPILAHLLGRQHPRQQHRSRKRLDSVKARRISTARRHHRRAPQEIGQPGQHELAPRGVAISRRADLPTPLNAAPRRSCRASGTPARSRSATSRAAQPPLVRPRRGDRNLRQAEIVAFDADRREPRRISRRVAANISAGPPLSEPFRPGPRSRTCCEYAGIAVGRVIGIGSDGAKTSKRRLETYRSRERHRDRALFNQQSGRHIIRHQRDIGQFDSRSNNSR